LPFTDVPVCQPAYKVFQRPKAFERELQAVWSNANELSH
jgi:hypothetical protein